MNLSGAWLQPKDITVTLARVEGNSDFGIVKETLILKYRPSNVLLVIYNRIFFALLLHHTIKDTPVAMKTKTTW